MLNHLKTLITFAQLTKSLADCNAAQDRLDVVKSIAAQTPHANDPDILRLAAEKQRNIDQARDLNKQAIKVLLTRSFLKL